MKSIYFLIFIFFQSYLFSQNPYVEIKFGTSNLHYYELTAATPGFHKGNLFQANIGNEFDLKKRNLFLNTSFFYRESNNSLNVDWINNIPSKNGFVFKTKLTGVESEIKKKLMIFKNNNYYLSPSFGLIFGFFTSQNFTNPIYSDKSFTLIYENYYLTEHKNEIKIIENFYFANKIGVELNYDFKNFSVIINPEIEYQLNHIFRTKQFDESYFNYNMGLGFKYHF